MPGLRPDQAYDLAWVGPVDLRAVSKSQPLDPAGPTGGVPVTGRHLADVGLWMPRRAPETVALVHLTPAGR